MVDNCTKFNLKIKDGRFVTVKKFPDSVKLCAEDLQDAQNKAPKVCIKRQNTNIARIRLHIKYENCNYRLKVQEETLKRTDKSDEPGRSSMLCGVIEVCYSSVVMELLEALNYSQLEKVCDIFKENLDDSHWFEKVNQGSGEYYSLRSVSKPEFYLYITGIQISISRDVQKRCLVKEIN